MRKNGDFEVGGNRIPNDKIMSNLFVFFILTMSVFLNQSMRVAGINFSIADFLMVFSVLYLLIGNKITFNEKHLVYFIILSISLMVTTLIITPIMYMNIFNTNSLLTEYLKILMSFTYVVLGYNIAKQGLSNKSLKYFSYTSYFIGIAGLLVYFLNIYALEKIMFYGPRLKGLMIDPNYYSTIQNSAMIYFILNNKYSNRYKSLMVFVNFILIALSGSKTGMLTFLMILSGIFMLKLIKKKSIKKSMLIKYLLIIFAIGILFPYILTSIIALLDYTASVFPVFSRVTVIFKDFSGALTDGGSSRDSSIGIALNIIKKSPITGVGLGTYLQIANYKYGSPVLAHNTYLQLFAEWGAFFSIIFFGYSFYSIFRTIKTQPIEEIEVKISFVLLCFLIGSMSISLNNARMFWYFYGILLGLNHYQRKF